ncbi:MAG: hypothetical protein NVS2B4_13390 [Ramlibacter sp.]
MLPERSVRRELQDLIAGSLDLAFLPFTMATRAQVSSGRFKVLAITADKRHPAALDVPTMAEAGFDQFIFLTTWGGLAVLAGSPPEFATSLNRASMTVLTEGELPRALREAGAIPTPVRMLEQVGAYHAADLRRYKDLLQSIPTCSRNELHRIKQPARPRCPWPATQARPAANNA